MDYGGFGVLFIYFLGIISLAIIGLFFAPLGVIFGLISNTAWLTAISLFFFVAAIIACVDTFLRFVMTQNSMNGKIDFVIPTACLTTLMLAETTLLLSHWLASAMPGNPFSSRLDGIMWGMLASGVVAGIITMRYFGKQTVQSLFNKKN